MSHFLLQIISISLTLQLACSVHNINDYNAVASEDSWAAATRNSHALSTAFLAANTSQLDRTVWIPPHEIFYFKNLTVTGLVDVTLIVDGTLKLNNDLVQWERAVDGKKEEALYFTNSEGIHITGSGTIDGQGLEWWRLAYLGVDYRPHFIEFYQGI